MSDRDNSGLGRFHYCQVEMIMTWELLVESIEGSLRLVNSLITRSILNVQTGECAELCPIWFVILLLDKQLFIHMLVN